MVKTTAKFNRQQSKTQKKKEVQEDKEKKKRVQQQQKGDYDYQLEEQEEEEEEEVEEVEEDTGNDEYNSVHLEQEEQEQEQEEQGGGGGSGGVSSYREDDDGEGEGEGEGEGFNNLNHGNSNSGGGGGGVQKKQKQHFGSFKTMGLESSLVRGIIKQGYNVPTPIQRKTIPIILSGKDVVAMARTGSGKTAAFLVPMFELLKVHSPKVGVRAVILSPTRELAMQTLKFVKQLGKYMDLRSCLLLGGDSMEAQFADLASNPDIIIATPGRLMHHIVEVGLSLRTVEYIVFDEADRLFEMGFASQLTEIISKLPEHRQTLLFSATLPQQLVEFARAGLSNPHLIRLDTETKISETLMLAFFTCRIEEKSAALLYLLKHIIDPSHQTIVFAATRHHVEYLYELLRFSGFDSAIIYGTMDQTARKINIGKFRNGKCKILIVTDVAARGIDIPLLNNVINYDFPPTAKLFIHRVGRAARMGRSGTAYSLVSADELPYMIDIHLFLGRPLQDSSDHVNTEGESCFGRLPQDVLDAENEFIKEQTRLHSELQNQYKVTLNAYKLYYKTRAKASGESVRRAKEASTDAIHPLILKKSSQEEKDRHLFIAGLKQFRPPQTVFELGRDPTKPAAIIMSAKRQQHSKLIEKAHNKQTTQNIPDEDVVLVSETPVISAETKRARDTSSEDKVKKKKQKIFRDEHYYMNSLPANHLAEKALSINETGLQSNNVAFEVAGDDAKTITQNTKVKKWDRKKKKYVWADQGVDVNNKKMMIKNESGRMIKAENRGKMYQDWQNKYKVSIQRSGETEDTTVISKFAGNAQRWEFKHQGTKSEEGNNRGRTPKPGKRDLKTKEQIQKQRKQEYVKRKKINAVAEKRNKPQHKKKR